MGSTFTIATSGERHPRRWWIVRIYDTLAALRRAASAYDRRADFTDCCHTAMWTDDAGVQHYGKRGYAGIIRLAAEHLTGEVIAHELVHAALGVYRMTVTPDVRLGRGVGPREEQLAYIFGELYAAFESRFQHSLSDLPTSNPDQ